MDDALSESFRIQSEASARGFDWPDVHGVLDKIEEELNEIREALREHDEMQAQRELGDLLLASVNAARFLGVHPSQALSEATARFSARFRAVQAALDSAGRRMELCTLEELDAVWNRVKSAADQSLEKRA